jgi:hypothetical protein
MFCSEWEVHIIEVYNVGDTTEICVKRANLGCCIFKLIGNVIQNIPITSSESVDALF